MATATATRTRKARTAPADNRVHDVAAAEGMAYTMMTRAENFMHLAANGDTATARVYWAKRWAAAMSIMTGKTYAV